MNKRKLSAFGKITQKRLALIIAFAFCFAVAANGQSEKRKKWTYDFSETVKYFDTPLEACKSFVKEKYPNDNSKASVEATNDPEIYRCYADENYFGVVYKRECKSCQSELTQARQSERHTNLQKQWALKVKPPEDGIPNT